MPGQCSGILSAWNPLPTLLAGKRLLAFYSSAPMSPVWFVVTCCTLPKQRELTAVTTLKTACCHYLSSSPFLTRPQASGARVWVSRVSVSPGTNSVPGMQLAFNKCH